MTGYHGKILRVDLSHRKITVESLDRSVYRDYIGGRGLGIYFLRREMDPRAEPLSPENVLVMATGPLTGTNTPTGSRYMVMTKSPLTGALTCSNSGGKFPTELKRAGYDAIVFTGRAETPLYLWLHDDRCELRDASHLWGRTTGETTDLLLAETDPSAKVACIGPAGENLVLFGSIMNDKHRAAGRSGVGAVLGAKNLKAVVVRGTGEIPIADPQVFSELQKRFREAFQAATRDNPPPLRLHGTAVTVMATQNYGVLPTRNWQQGTFAGWENIHGETLSRKYLKRNSYCFSCPIGCGRRTKVEEKGFEGEGEGPEYETVYALGSNCMVDNLAAVTKANYLCNELGIDTISMGATIGCAMELFQRGKIPAEMLGDDLKGLDWGDGQVLVQLVRQTGYRRGFGDLLALGSYRLAEKLGFPEYAMVSKKQEFPGYDPRGAQGMGLAYATSPIGGSHMRGDPAYFELLGVPTMVDPLEWHGKAELVKIWQDLFCVIDSAGLCVFYAVRYLTDGKLAIKPSGIKDFLNAVTGADYSLEELCRAGERIANAERAFLVEAGFSRDDDTLPARLTGDPLPDGPARGSVCHLEEMLDEYYKARGWSQDGVPHKERLRELGIVSSQKY